MGGGECDVPLASLDLATSIGEAQLHILARGRPMWGSARPSLLSGGATVVRQSIQTQPRASWKMEEAPPKKQVQLGTSWAELREG